MSVGSACDFWRAGDSGPGPQRDRRRDLLQFHAGSGDGGPLRRDYLLLGGASRARGGLGMRCSWCRCRKWGTLWRTRCTAKSGARMGR